jgi:aminoethylphosphonate catabolism LysR family transcriptional regulator
MRYSQLRAFHQVALHGGFSRAAEFLNQTQPALSDQVRRLEQEHDVLLFHRDRKQVRLTPQGEALFLLTKRFFEAEQNIREHLAESGAAIGRTLRIVADSALHITETLGRFRAAHPGVFVQLRTGNSEQVLQALRNYDAEIGVVGSLEPASDLVTVDLGSTPIRAVVAREFLPARVTELRFDELTNWPLIFREKGSRTRLALEQAAEAIGLSLRPVMEVDGREAMREVVASGAGIGFVSEAEFGTDPRLVKLPVAGADLRMTETLVYLAMRREVPVIRAFTKVLGASS